MICNECGMTCSPCPCCKDLAVRLARVVEAGGWVLKYDHGPDCKSCQSGRSALAAALAAAQDASPEPHPFRPCLREGEPGHNFTCALLCTICGLPREKHASPEEGK
jgi:hypothetical protein